ncbi:FAD/NAD(P)-binding domain-containing protein [Amylostereum chailletii]|nr:FAD/NAD(P)-binding domain-containing protein [Amylostereum chailletii]
MGYSCTRIERREALLEKKGIGAGVMIWFRTWRILELLGLAEDFAKVAHAVPDGSTGIGFDYRKSDVPHEGSRFHLFELPYGCIRFHRAHFLDTFIQHLPPGIAHFGKRLTSYSTSDSTGETGLRFADGTEATCDILVGCDGIKSAVREIMFRRLAEKNGNPELLKYIHPVWSGIVAYRGLVPVEKLRKGDANHRAVQNPMMYCGQSKHVVSYAISQGTIVNVITFVSQLKKEGTEWNAPWVEECSREELLDCFSGWEPEVCELLECIEKPTRWGLHMLKPIPTYVSRNVVLVGDSAHAMLPHQGAGAGQAIEDAYTLAALLGDPSVTPSTLPSALAAYEAIRLPQANHVLRGSRESGMMYEFNSALRDRYTELGPAIEHMWDWLWVRGPEKDARRALAMMKSQVQTRL